MLLDNKFKISVIIPVFNAENFIQQAVESALEQPETHEVILIEDGSPDNSLDVCLSLTSLHEKVYLLQHERGVNKGAAASRNLGIRNARCEYVAFLDADDYYLPGRFKKTMEVFKSEHNVDGVYEAIGSKFENDNSKELFQSVGLRETTTINKGILPEDLFKSFMVGGTGGFFSIIGFTAKREVFDKVAYLDERLDMYEDTMVMFQLSSKCRLFPGNLDTPVAIRRVHKANRITYRFNDKRKTYETLARFWDLYTEWAVSNLSNEQMDWVYDKVISQLKNADYSKDSFWENFLFSRKKLIRFAIRNPKVIKKYCLWRSLLPL
jgi:glycosyltransferase involved in cell wall biosynthesis